MSDHRLTLLGPPGSGKGTQAAILVEQLGIPYLGTGDLIRATAKEDTALGEELRGVIANNAFASDDLMLRMVSERIGDEPSYLLDGFPRTLPQAISFQNQQGEQGLTHAIYFQMTDTLAASRISQRRVCGDCAAIYHLKNRPPMTVNICDRCGGDLQWRSDDQADKIAKRLSDYHSLTVPLLHWYGENNLLYPINAAGETAAVTNAVLELLEIS